MQNRLAPAIDKGAGVTAPISLLLVDDSHFDRARVRRLAQRTGLLIDLQEAQGPQQMFTCLTQRTFDIILLDFYLPEADGLTCAERLRSEKSWAHLGVLLVSGSGDPDLRARAIAAGCDGCLSKTGLKAGELRESLMHTQFIQSMRAALDVLRDVKPVHLH